MWMQLILVTLFAAVAQGVAGFGFTLLAVSFFLITLRSTDAVQLVILINFAISVVLVGRLWRAVPPRLWMLLAGGGLLGFPVGLWAFARADLELIEIAVAAVTITFAVVVLVQEMHGATRFAARAPRPGSGAPANVATAGANPAPNPAPNAVLNAVPTAPANALPTAPRVVVHRPLSALAIGVAAGAMTSSIGAPGPPVVLYLTGLRLDKTTFRSLALSTFMVTQLGSLLGQSLYVGIDARVWGYALVLVPVGALGAAAGHRLCHYVSEQAFRRVVLVLLLATGGYMLYRALAG